MSRTITILCIEDETMLLEDICEELQEQGYEVIPACDGREALEILQTQRPDLILCDVMMPGMNGAELLEHIRAEMPDLAGIPFVFLTAKATREDIIAGKELGVDDYLTKPIDFGLLHATIGSRLREVWRLQKANRRKLRELYDEVKGLRTTHSTLKIALVSSNERVTEPISLALRELGCEVDNVPERRLTQLDFSLDRYDLVFFLYSAIAYNYLKYQDYSSHEARAARFAILAPPYFWETEQLVLMQAGLEEFVEYPYRPSHIFRIILRRTRQLALRERTANELHDSFMTG